MGNAARQHLAMSVANSLLRTRGVLLLSTLTESPCASATLLQTKNMEDFLIFKPGGGCIREEIQRIAWRSLHGVQGQTKVLKVTHSKDKDALPLTTQVAARESSKEEKIWTQLGSRWLPFLP